MIPLLSGMGRNLPSRPILLKLVFTVSIGLIAIMEPDYKLSILEHMVLAVRRRGEVGVHDLLRDEGEFRQDGWVPLDYVFLRGDQTSTMDGGRTTAKTYQGVYFCLLEVVEAVDGIVPRIEEVLRPFTASNNHAPRLETLMVLGEDKFNPFRWHMSVRLDDRIWRDDGHITPHKLAKPCRICDMIFQRQRRVHDDCVLVEIPEVLGVRVFGHSMADGGEGCPAVWDCANGVVGHVFHEDCVSCGGRGGVSAPPFQLWPLP